jgi:transposase-like protein
MPTWICPASGTSCTRTETPRLRKRYSPEFRQHMVELLRSGRGSNELGREFGVSLVDSTLGQAGRARCRRGRCWTDEHGARGAVAVAIGEPAPEGRASAPRKSSGIAHRNVIGIGMLVESSARAKVTLSDSWREWQLLGG